MLSLAERRKQSWLRAAKESESVMQIYKSHSLDNSFIDAAFRLARYTTEEQFVSDMSEYLNENIARSMYRYYSVFFLKRLHPEVK